MNAMHKIITVLGINAIPVGLWLANAANISIIISSVIGIMYTGVMFLDRYKLKNKNK